MVLLVLLLIAVPLAAGIYIVIARHRFQLQLQHLWLALRAHWLATGLLALYGVTVGVALVTGFNTPLEAFLLAFPVVAGICAGWWEVRRDGVRASARVFDQGILVGLLATALPVLLMIAGDLWLAWQTGWFIADPERIAVGAPVGWGALWGNLLFAAGIYLGMGAILGVIGAYVGLGLAKLPNLFHHSGPQTPSIQG